MQAELMRGAILDRLRQIAPEADLDAIRPDLRFRDQFEFDSVDFLNFALALQEHFGVIIPEEDFPTLATLDGCISYLVSRAS